MLYFAIAAFAPVSPVRISSTPSPGEPPPSIEDELQQSANEGFIRWAPRALFVLVPVFAGLVALAARRAPQNYPQHLYFALHIHAAWFFAAAVATTALIWPIPYLSDVVRAAAPIYVGWYAVTAFSRAYVPRVRWPRVVGVLLAYVTLVLVVIAGAIGIMLSRAPR